MSTGNEGSGCPFHRLFKSNNAPGADCPAQGHGAQAAEPARSPNQKPSAVTQNQKQSLQNNKVEVNS